MHSALEAQTTVVLFVQPIFMHMHALLAMLLTTERFNRTHIVRFNIFEVIELNPQCLDAPILVSYHALATHAQ